MKKFLVLSVMFLSLMSCKQTRIESSDILHEEATVAMEIYSPATHRMERTFSSTEIGPVSVDYQGRMGISTGDGMQITQVEVKPIYGILFRCQHGTFTSQGIDARHQELYNRLKNSIGKKVDVTYKELYRTTYETNKEHKKPIIISRVLDSYDFIGAELKNDN